MDLVKDIVLIVFSCTSLLIALYCLFFMVPVKRFWERIRSLGGGMKGIESHVEGMREEIRARLDEVEQGAREQLEREREANREALDRLAQQEQVLRGELGKLRKDIQALHAELRQTSSDAMKLTQSAGALTKELGQLRSDFDAFDVELREAVRQLVADSFSSVESTVLSALEAIQGEIIYGASSPPEGSRPFGPPQDTGRSATPRRGSGGRAAPENITTIEPLFAEMRQEDADREEDDEAGGDEEGASGDAEDPDQG